MGLHSSGGRALQRERSGHGLKPRKSFFGLILQLLKLRYNCEDHIFIPSMFIICIQSFSFGKTPLYHQFSFITDLDPCLGVHCPSFGVCKTYSAHEARCVCYEDCPSIVDPVCTSNGTTYDNKCWHELSYCRGLDNNTVYHPGSCEGEYGSPSKEIQF